jgi:hypothetical protein
MAVADCQHLARSLVCDVHHVDVVVALDALTILRSKHWTPEISNWWSRPVGRIGHEDEIRAISSIVSRHFKCSSREKLLVHLPRSIVVLHQQFFSPLSVPGLVDARV